MPESQPKYLTGDSSAERLAAEREVAGVAREHRSRECVRRRSTIASKDCCHRAASRATRQYAGWVVVDELDEPAAGGQRILRIQSPDGSEETLVTSQVALFGLGDPD